MTMVPVKSGNVESIGHDPSKSELYVKFKTGPTIYTYPNVTVGQHRMLMTAPSKGSHISRYFRAK